MSRLTPNEFECYWRNSPTLVGIFQQYIFLCRRRFLSPRSILTFIIASPLFGFSFITYGDNRRRDFESKLFIFNFLPHFYNWLYIKLCFWIWISTRLRRPFTDLYSLCRGLYWFGTNTTLDRGMIKCWANILHKQG